MDVDSKKKSHKTLNSSEQAARKKIEKRAKGSRIAFTRFKDKKSKSRK